MLSIYTRARVLCAHVCVCVREGEWCATAINTLRTPDRSHVKRSLQQTRKLLLFIWFPVCNYPEQPDRLLHVWIEAFVAKVAAVRPLFIGLHLQEVGGKTYEKSMEYVQDFIRILCEAPELQRFTRIRVYLDEDYTSAEHFTVSVCVWVCVAQTTVPFIVELCGPVMPHVTM